MDRAIFDTYERFHKKFWYSMTRNELIKALIKKYYSISGIVLDCGCGTGFNHTSFKGAKFIVSADISSLALNICKKRNIPNLVRADAQKLPFADKSFDSVAAIELIEHLDNDLLALKEIKRVLKPNGIAIITAPAFKFLWSDDDILAHHKRRYTKSDLMCKIKKAGFRIDFFSYRYFFLFPPTVVFFVLKNVWRKLFGGEPKNSLEGSFGNFFLTAIARLENKMLVKGIRLPIGVGFVGILRKI